MKYSAKQTENKRAQGLPSKVVEKRFFLQPLGLIENLTAKKDLTLFDIDTKTTSSLFLSDNGNRKVYLLPRQMRVLEVLMRRVYREIVAMGDPRVEKYIADLPKQMEEQSARQQAAIKEMKDAGKEVVWAKVYDNGPTRRKGPLLTHIDLIEMAKELYPSGKGGKQLKALETDLREMHSVWQEFRFPRAGRKGYYPLIMPVLTMVEIGEKNEKGELINAFAQIEVGDAMLFRIREAYIISPLDLPERLRDEKCHTELFTLLVMLLQKEWYPCLKKAEAAVRNIEKRMVAEGITDTDIIGAAAAKAADKALIYTERAFSIIQRVNSKPFLQKAYIRYERIDTEFQRAGDALVRIGLIKWWREAKADDGSPAYSFRLNEHWVNVLHFENSLHLPKEE